MLHGLELIADLLLADTETTMGLSLTLDVLKLNGDVEAALMEVGSRFIVVVLLKHLSHLLVDEEALAHLLLTPVELSLLKFVTDVGQGLGVLLELNLDLFVEFLIFQVLLTWLNGGGSGVGSQVEEVNISLHEALGKEANANAHLVNLFLQLETSVFLLNSETCPTGDSGFLSLLACSSILLEHLGLGRIDQFVLLLGLGLLDDLTDAGVRVHNWLVFHLPTTV